MQIWGHGLVLAAEGSGGKGSLTELLRGLSTMTNSWGAFSMMTELLGAGEEEGSMEVAQVATECGGRRRGWAPPGWMTSSRVWIQGRVREGGG